MARRHESNSNTAHRALFMIKIPVITLSYFISHLSQSILGWAPILPKTFFTFCAVQRHTAKISKALDLLVCHGRPCSSVTIDKWVYYLVFQRAMMSNRPSCRLHRLLRWEQSATLLSICLILLCFSQILIGTFNRNRVHCKEYKSQWPNQKRNVTLLFTELPIAIFYVFWLPVCSLH